MRIELQRQISHCLGAHFVEQLKSQFGDQFKNQLWGQLWDQLYSRLKGQRRDQLRLHLWYQFKRVIKE